LLNVRIDSIRKQQAKFDLSENRFAKSLFLYSQHTMNRICIVRSSSRLTLLFVIVIRRINRSSDVMLVWVFGSVAQCVAPPPPPNNAQRARAALAGACQVPRRAGAPIDDAERRRRRGGRDDDVVVEERK
jgi:hypothetical protein